MLKTSNQAQLNDYQLRIRETTQIRCNAYVTNMYYTAYSTTFILLSPFHNNNILCVLNKLLSIHSRGGRPYWGKVCRGKVTKFWLGDANLSPQIFLPDKYYQIMEISEGKWQNFFVSPQWMLYSTP